MGANQQHAQHRDRGTGGGDPDKDGPGGRGPSAPASHDIADSGHQTGEPGPEQQQGGRKPQDFSPGPGGNQPVHHDDGGQKQPAEDQKDHREPDSTGRHRRIAVGAARALAGILRMAAGTAPGAIGRLPLQEDERDQRQNKGAEIIDGIPEIGHIQTGRIPDDGPYPRQPQQEQQAVEPDKGGGRGAIPLSFGEEEQPEQGQPGGEADGDGPFHAHHRKIPQAKKDQPSPQA